MLAYDLDVLRRNRKAILKAELGAFLHNIGKLGAEFINSTLSGPKFGYQNVAGVLEEILRTCGATLSRDAKQRFRQSLDALDPVLTWAFLPASGDFAQWLRGTEIRLPAPFDDRTQHPYHIADLIEFQDAKWYEDDSRRIRDLFGTTSHLTELLEASHHASAVDKNLNGDGEMQRALPVHLATVFGHERPIDTATLKPAREKLLASVQRGDRNEYLREASKLMVMALAETRRPLNDITLWDVSSAVAAFFKAAVAKMLLEGEWTRNPREKLKWRILRVALDGPAFYQHVSRLPDLLARKEVLTHSLDAVKRLLEEEYPLANEVYRDEFTSAFVIPDLDGEDEKGRVIRGLIEDHVRDAFRTRFEINGDVRQQERAEASRAVKLEITPSLFVSSAHPEGLGLAHELAKTPPTVTAKPEIVREWWQGVQRADICTVCGVRPQGHPTGRISAKARQRHVCVPCEALRDDRCEKWLGALERTIWLDEVADLNGRIALITGSFGIDEWLKPDGYVRSSLVVNPAPSDPTRRFKELTFARLRRIWDTTARFWEDIEREVKQCLVPASGVRWRLRVRPGPASDEPPVRTHAYQLEIPNVGRLAVVCTDGVRWEFITAENLERLARFHQTSPDELLQRIPEQECTVYEDKYDEHAGYTRATSIATGTILGPAPDSTRYRGVIRILAGPRSFMMLVPALNAGEILEEIKNKYETEMARVRNRLPIALGLVFAEAHMPLSTVLDAGRRMMKLPVAEEKWTICTAPAICGNDRILTFSNGVTWKCATVMQDGMTEDKWYAYFLPAPSGDVMHISELQTGSEVKVTPSKFDLQIMDCAATRFELDYSERGKKRRLPRPYLLENWETLGRVWRLLSAGLATSQTKALHADLGAKRAQWAEAGDKTFAKFVRDTLATLDWNQALSPADLNFLAQAGIGGLLEDAVELHMGLLKQKAGEGGDSE